jgi:DNA-directed RNA polymerase III subunit RPC8
MFVLKTFQDMIRIPSSLLSLSTTRAIQNEIDEKYPNRVIMGAGLVIGRYSDTLLEVGHGICVDGGSHHQCTFQMILFQPFVDEVLLGTIRKSTPEGVSVSLGFFQDIFIPAYWMLNPSRYEESTGLWVWTPTFDEEEQEPDIGTIKTEEEPQDDERYEMYLGAPIRFKVKSIQFTQITNTAKGMQATQTNPQEEYMSNGRRQRSSSVGLLDETKAPPAAMQIVASICEDGLGLTSWWEQQPEEDENEDDENVDFEL